MQEIEGVGRLDLLLVIGNAEDQLEILKGKIFGKKTTKAKAADVPISTEFDVRFSLCLSGAVMFTQRQAAYYRAGECGKAYVLNDDRTIRGEIAEAELELDQALRFALLDLTLTWHVVHVAYWQGLSRYVLISWVTVCDVDKQAIEATIAECLRKSVAYYHQTLEQKLERLTEMAKNTASVSDEALQTELQRLCLTVDEAFLSAILGCMLGFLPWRTAFVERFILEMLEPLRIDYPVWYAAVIAPLLAPYQERS